MLLTTERRVELDVGVAYDEHADFVWQSLHRLGVRSAELPDLLQEVFLVLHRRRREYDATRPLRAWLWGICVGLVRNHRRRTATRGERALAHDPPAHGDDPEHAPEHAIDRRRQREKGRRALERMDPERRAVFVMFEVEGMSGREIADALDVPLGTVHSRLHAARADLSLALVEEDP